MQGFAAIILAAGKGTRMKSCLCKVLHPVAGRPMLSYVIDTVRACDLEKIVLVVGHQAQDVMNHYTGSGVEFAVQEPQLGTGHAVAAAREQLRSSSGDILILCGDIPLIRPETLRDFMGFHRHNESALTVMTTNVENPCGYGRILRNEHGHIVGIAEEKDATQTQREVHEINTGIYIAKSDLLFSLLSQIRNDNAQGEYYLTDIITAAVQQSVPVHCFVLQNCLEGLGINTRGELAFASAAIWQKTRMDLMESGVTLLDPGTVYVDSGVEIGPDSIVHPVVSISGNTTVGRECIIESGVYIINSRIGDGVQILQGSRLNEAIVEDGTTVGPMAHLRPGTIIGKHARVGNFVEIKKSVVGDGSKASHLTYLGDSTIGKHVNIGCGTITCNYDGVKKHPTVIGDHCFVGSDVQFIAPVEVGEGSLIGAGSTITKDVPPQSLAVSRSRQKVYPLRKGQGSASPDEDRKS
ncbi:MAG TPA: bifunctional UDP-N-acetylglucosamine diphosphorylase/glucosamine-1-phosphate N-acetyltransferase GlmU [Desulfomonilaceae bacterium]|nr:bifunctional UDP-N-acetylglucosamine diphosphorylase/glucosamine-1-phosphate N-acetyltransferase GlmU [Desulfomonilaceae bacterium]